ncbi:MAG: bifunctional (p)ppGpp synthetase/guanosine-3',5'-bis(diphosphate) 3'-pyrophosphohydrolase, partial [Anaerolineales bacterium]|nr:bifunctional (p)ppGpp synthetase/guanosine-3',5'-bis(diphosphate) 3'-pyrophosphohydrolase [Anaerolineales bacterium]
MRIENLMENLPPSYTPVDRELVLRAYKVAETAHEGQKRASGEPYINHCLAVASILTDLRVPPQVVSAGLLHDTVEDTDITLENIRNDFGDEIALLVDGVTKLTQLPRVSRGDQRPEDQAKEEEQRQIAQRRGLPDPETEADQLVRSRRYDLVAETLRKTFLAMGEDVNVVLIKLADRLHNMRTLGYMPEKKRRRIAQETLDIFAPLANRLGIWQEKWELEDLAFRYVNPDMYKEIAGYLASRRTRREREMQEIKKKLVDCLSQAGIEADVSSRPKHIYSIYKKMVRKDVPFDLVFDVRGVRIIVPEVPDCYSALGVIHTHWRPIPNEFDDYIAVPKDNFYRSLHTAVVYDDGQTLEVQIRTLEMHQSAEYGIAAHWRYKEGTGRGEDYERRIMWLRSLMEWRQDVDDAADFVDTMKSEVFDDRVYVFTPKGDIIDLPTGSTPIDFAYHIHTDIGHRCRGSKTNGKLVSLSHKLQTGDSVEILTTKRGGPSRDWLNPSLEMVKSQRARSKIRQWFRRRNRELNISHGRLLLERELRRLGIEGISYEKIARDLGYSHVEDLHVAIGCGDINLGKIAAQVVKEDIQALDLTKELKAEPSPVMAADEVTILGVSG